MEGEPGPDELFLAGGGFRVLPFLGALLDVKLHRVRAFTGLSSGALLALLLSLGYGESEILELALSEEWPRAFRASCSFAGALRAGKPLVSDSPVRVLVEEVLRRRGLPPEATLRDLALSSGRRLRVVVANVSTERLEVLTPESHGHVSVAAALLASTAVPLVFPEVLLPAGPHGEAALFFDAGVLNNSAVHMRCGPRTLALLLAQDSSVRYDHAGSSPLCAQACFCSALAFSLLPAASVAAADPDCELAFMPKVAGVQPLQQLERAQALRCVLLGLLAWRLRPHLQLLLVGVVLAVCRATSMCFGDSLPGAPRPSGPSDNWPLTLRTRIVPRSWTPTSAASSSGAARGATPTMSFDASSSIRARQTEAPPSSR